MQANELRKKFLDFFEKRGHKIVPSSSLIPDDPSVLLTTAGMQQFKKYYTEPEMAERDFGGRNTASIQKSFRTSDIDEVGDERHLTFFEMMGNFSFGGYFKEEAIRYAYEFFKEIGLSIEYVTIFGGVTSENGVPQDNESARIWRDLGINRIEKRGREDNFWGPTGSEGPCGPTTEIYVNGTEIWNIVFNEYYCFPDGRLEKLSIPGVDTGMGLERLAMVSQDKKNIFETDLFRPFMLFLQGNPRYQEQHGRIVADHMRAAVFLLADGVRPSNKERGYVLRRLIRRAIVHSQPFSRQALFNRINYVIEQYASFSDYHSLKENKEIIEREFVAEAEKFDATLRKGMKEFFDKFPEMKAQRITGEQSVRPHRIQRISGEDAFYFQQSFGLTLDIIKDFARRGGHVVEIDEQGFEKAIERHREISRAGAEAKFGGHGLYLKTGEVTIRDESEVEKVTRLHTATHLLHAGLRAVLGPEVRQDGSDITVERTRFDFRFGRKVTPEELKKVEEWVNDMIQRDLSVEWEEMTYEEAIRQGALGFFREKYPARVKVYSVYDPQTGEVVSRELCGGPHVEHTGQIGHFKILKEESSSAGVRRIRAIVE